MAWQALQESRVEGRTMEGREKLERFVHNKGRRGRVSGGRKKRRRGNEARSHNSAGNDGGDGDGGVTEELQWEAVERDMRKHDLTPSNVVHQKVREGGAWVWAGYCVHVRTCFV